MEKELKKERKKKKWKWRRRSYQTKSMNEVKWWERGIGCFQRLTLWRRSQICKREGPLSLLIRLCFMPFCHPLPFAYGPISSFSYKIVGFPIIYSYHYIIIINYNNFYVNFILSIINIMGRHYKREEKATAQKLGFIFSVVLMQKKLGYFNFLVINKICC